MKLNLLFSVIVLLVVSCSSTKNSSKSTIPTPSNEFSFLLTKKSTDATYGYTKKNPIKVGGIHESSGPKNEQKFLNALAGPKGEKISYIRTRSCCSFKSENGILGTGMLDVYEITWEGLKKPITLYLNMYDTDELKIPVGFELKQKQASTFIELDKTFFLKKGNHGLYKKAGLSISLESIRNNLCPPGVKCPRAGEIAVDVLVKNKEEMKTYTLVSPITNIQTQINQIRVGDLQIEFLGPMDWMKGKNDHPTEKSKIDNTSSMSFVVKHVE